MLTIKLLGSPTFVLHNESISHLLGGRAAALLIYLAVTRQPQPRTQITDLLWEEIPEHQAKANLRYRLSDLRKVVGDYIIASGDTLTFNQNLPHWIDITVFTTYMSQTVPSATPGPEASRVEPGILQELLNLYTGEFLAGFLVDQATAFERWMIAQRRHLHDLLIRGLQLRTQQHLDHAEYAEGLVLNHQLLTLEPWREEAHRQRMVLLAHSGQRSAALQQYTRCCQILTEELDVSPMPQTTALYDAIKSGQWFNNNLASSHQPIPAAVIPFPTEGTTHPQPKSTHVIGKPTPATPRFDLGAMPEAPHFFGRQAELTTLHSWVGQEKSQFIALLGLSGQGKTALAATFVQEVVDNEQNPAHGFTNVIWRSLQSTPSCIEILQGWLHTLDGTDQEALPTSFDELVTRLFALLQTRRCLLVLDGVDALLQSPTIWENSEAETYYPGCESYAQLFQLFFQRRHRSCLLLTSRYRPAVLSQLDERNRAFHRLTVNGLDLADSATLLAIHGIGGDQAIHRQLHHHYAGNPQMLNQAANLIHECFGGDSKAFVEQGVYFLGDIGIALAQQVTKLLPLEQQILYTLGQAKQPLTRQTLWLQLTPPPAKRAYFHAMQRLQRTSLLQFINEQIKVTVPLPSYLCERDLASEISEDLEIHQALPQ